MGCGNSRDALPPQQSQQLHKQVLKQKQPQGDKNNKPNIPLNINTDNAYQKETTEDNDHNELQIQNNQEQQHNFRSSPSKIHLTVNVDKKTHKNKIKTKKAKNDPKLAELVRLYGL